jgi:hypothetical protein
VIVGEMDANDIETLLSKETLKSPEVPEASHDRRRVARLQAMIQIESIGPSNPLLRHPARQTLPFRIRGPLVSEHHIVASIREGLAEGNHRLSGPRPFPIAKEMENFQWHLSKND